MKRDEPAFQGGPVTADVHPDEVQGFLDLGWSLDQAPAKPPKKKGKAEKEGTDDAEVSGK